MRRRVFRALWIAQFAANVGTWTQMVGAQWLMGDLTTGTLPVALVQTATTLPVFLLVLPAGALGDIVDRRRQLLVGQSLMLGGAAALAAVTAADVISAPLLLGLIAAMGVGQALSMPCFQAIQAELVPAAELPQAALLNGANSNVAQAVGPALGGILVASVGPAATFAVNAASFVGVLLVLYRWRRPIDHRPLGPEHIRSALRAGARYVGSAPAFRMVLVRATMFIMFASALWALLPVVARGPLGLGAGGYGALLGCVGAGALAGAFLVPPARARLGRDQLVIAATLAYAMGLVVVAEVRVVAVVGLALVVVGLSWLAVLSTLNAMAQLLLPRWTRARALAYWQLGFMGGQGLGALAWGGVSDALSLRMALLVPAGALVVTAALARLHLPLPVRELDVAHAEVWPEPSVHREPPPEAGPVLVIVEWHVDPENAAAFLHAMAAVGDARRRTGAELWGVFEDLEDPAVYLETLIVATWHEHLRQHLERGTVMDRESEARARSLTIDGVPHVRHLLWSSSPSLREARRLRRR